MATIQVEIVSAERAIYSGEAAMVYAPAIMGEVGIAPGHMALLTRMNPGEVRVELPSGEQQAFYAANGFIHIEGMFAAETHEDPAGNPAGPGPRHQEKRFS